MLLGRIVSLYGHVFLITIFCQGHFANAIWVVVRNRFPKARISWMSSHLWRTPKVRSLLNARCLLGPQPHHPCEDLLLQPGMHSTYLEYHHALLVFRRGYFRSILA
ncbi:hypothetical protein BJX99DRAFT_236514 [Aspergillus californicus]